MDGLADSANDPAPIVVWNRPIFVFRASYEGMSPAERASASLELVVARNVESHGHTVRTLTPAVQGRRSVWCRHGFPTGVRIGVDVEEAMHDVRQLLADAGGANPRLALASVKALADELDWLLVRAVQPARLHLYRRDRPVRQRLGSRAQSSKLGTRDRPRVHA